jgi:hypothetical protein
MVPRDCHVVQNCRATVCWQWGDTDLGWDESMSPPAGVPPFPLPVSVSGVHIESLPTACGIL